MANHIFAEPAPGEVAHTASSRILVQQDMRDTIAMMNQEIWQPTLRVVEAVRESPEAEEPEKAAFASVNGGRSMWDVLREEPERARRFGASMRWYVNLVRCTDPIPRESDTVIPVALHNALEVGRCFDDL